MTAPMTDPQAALRARAEQLAESFRKAGEEFARQGYQPEESIAHEREAVIRDLLAALVGARPPVDLKMRDSVLYAELKDLWSAMHFDPETMPVPIMRDACRVAKEGLDAMLKGFEGKSFRQWCDEQWDDGLPQRTEVGARPPAQPSITEADCKNAYRNGYQAGEADALRRVASTMKKRPPAQDEKEVMSSEANIGTPVSRSNSEITGGSHPVEQHASTASPLPRPEARLQIDLVPCVVCGWPMHPEVNNLNLICPCCGFEPEFDSAMSGGVEGYKARWNGEWWADDAERKPAILLNLEAEVRALEARLRAVVEQLSEPTELLETVVRLDDSDVMQLSYGHWYSARGIQALLARLAKELNAILRPSATRTPPEKE